MALAVGDRVVEAGRSGAVVALRPGGMVDVKWPDGGISRRPMSKLSKPGGRLAMRSNHHLTVGQHVRMGTSAGTVVKTHTPDSYDVDFGGGMLRILVPGSMLVPSGGQAGTRQNTRVNANRQLSLLPKPKRRRAVGAKTRVVRAKARARVVGAKTRTLPPEDPHEEQLRRVALAVYESLTRRYKRPEGRATLSRAYAIATGRLQKYGYIVPGTRMPTIKGIKRAREKLATPDAEIKRQAYEHVLARARKGGTYRVIEHDGAWLVEPGGKLFYTEAKALRYVESVGGTVSFREGRRVRGEARRAGEAEKRARRKGRKAARKVVGFHRNRRNRRNPVTFVVGDTVTFRGQRTRGTVTALQPASGTVRVEWHDGEVGNHDPRMLFKARGADPVLRGLARESGPAIARGLEYFRPQMTWSIKDAMYQLVGPPKIGSKLPGGWRHEPQVARAGVGYSMWVTEHDGVARRTAVALNIPMPPGRDVMLPKGRTKKATRRPVGWAPYAQDIREGVEATTIIAPTSRRSVASGAPVVRVQKQSDGWHVTVTGLRVRGAAKRLSGGPYDTRAQAVAAGRRAAEKLTRATERVNRAGGGSMFQRNPRTKGRRAATYRGMIIRSCAGIYIVEAYGEPFRVMSEAKRWIDDKLGGPRIAAVG
jgi:hypothetical protein